METKVTLYISTHNKTGKKYFGKTTRFFTDKELNENYNGSGTLWKKHLEKYGNDVTVEIYMICSTNNLDEDYVEPIALKFSEDNNIVDDYTIWLNQRPENGLDGGSNGISGLSLEEYHGKEKSKEIKLKQSLYAKNRSEEHQQKLNELLKGRKLSETHRQNIGFGTKGLLKDKTHEEIYGKERSQILKKNLSNFRKDKTYEEIMGEEKAMETKKKKSETMKKLAENSNYINSIKNGMKTRSAQEKMRKKVTCPHCKKEGKMGPMSRWHFNNCKMKDKDEN